MVDTIFSLTESEHLRETFHYASQGPLFEALVIHGCREMSKLRDGRNLPMESPLREEYTKYLSEREENGGNENRYRYAEMVLGYTEGQNLPRSGLVTVGFKDAVERIELISEAMLGDDA